MARTRTRIHLLITHSGSFANVTFFVSLFLVCILCWYGVDDPLAVSDSVGRVLSLHNQRETSENTTRKEERKEMDNTRWGEEREEKEEREKRQIRKKGDKRETTEGRYNARETREKKSSLTLVFSLFRATGMREKALLMRRFFSLPERTSL